MVNSKEIERLKRIGDDIDQAVKWLAFLTPDSMEYKQRIANDLQHALLLIHQTIRSANIPEG